MALAWNAGWVNSPRGFKSRILRAQSGVWPGLNDRGLVAPDTSSRRRMGRKAAVFWHAAFSIIASLLYFGFVLPRWWELMGDTSHALGTALRIVAGVLIALAALPVAFTWLRARNPEYGTPQLALTLQTSSIVAHVLAGVLIVGTAISEIWLNLDTVGQWLFGVYGAAAAIALLGIFGFYLSFIAELPPPPPKPIKRKKEKQRRQRRKKGGEDEADEAEEDEAEATEDEATEADAAGRLAHPTPQRQVVSGAPAQTSARQWCRRRRLNHRSAAVAPSGPATRLSSGRPPRYCRAGSGCSPARRQ